MAPLANMHLGGAGQLLESGGAISDDAKENGGRQPLHRSLKPTSGLRRGTILRMSEAHIIAAGRRGTRRGVAHASLDVEGPAQHARPPCVFKAFV
jgi:hypothetical protein